MVNEDKKECDEEKRLKSFLLKELTYIMVDLRTITEKYRLFGCNLQ